jgi:hypothetical protein
MPTCICRRCEEITECITIAFVVQHGFDEETTCDLCEDCYNLYRQLYTTRVIEEGDFDFVEEDDAGYENGVIAYNDAEDENPAPPISYADADIDADPK